MKHDEVDSSGTDDDLPVSHPNTGGRGPMTVNGRNLVGVPHSRAQNDMEALIHRLEQEAYSSVLRAFKAQADAITWEKEGVITELRKELRVLDDEHRLILSKVNADDILQQIRKWRQQGGPVNGFVSSSQTLHDQAPSSSVSASRKRQKTVLSFAAPSSSAGELAVPIGSKGKQPKQILPGGCKVKSLPYSSTNPSGRGQIANTSYGTGTELIEAVTCDPLIGRKLITRWPADNNFYEAVITNSSPEQGLHLLVYDKGLPSESFEWVNLKEIPPEDIQWKDDDPVIANEAFHGRPSHGIKQPIGQGGVNQGAGRGRGPHKTLASKDLELSQNVVGKDYGEIEICITDMLIKEVERVFNSSHPDPREMEKMKILMKEHEDSLVDALLRIANYEYGKTA